MVFNPGTATGFDTSKTSPFLPIKTGPVPIPKAAPASSSSYLSEFSKNAANDIFVTAYLPSRAARLRASISSKTKSKSDSVLPSIAAKYENVSFGQGVIANSIGYPIVL